MKKEQVLEMLEPRLLLAAAPIGPGEIVAFVTGGGNFIIKERGAGDAEIVVSQTDVGEYLITGLNGTTIN